jgi:hypothetical protein
MSAARAKGTAWESAVVDFLTRNGFPHAERRALNGAVDKGDVAGIPGVVIEAKNCKTINLAQFLDEANRERDNAGAAIGVAWIKRRGKASAANGYVVMDGPTFVALLRGAGWGDDLSGGVA